MEAEVIVPGGAELLAADAALAVVLTEQRSRHAAEHRQVLGGRPVLQAAVVLPEDDVEHPVQPVLYPPVQTRRATQLLGAAAPAADVVGHLASLLAAHRPDAGYAEEAPQVQQVAPATQPAEVVQLRSGPLLFPAVPARLAQP